MIAVLVGLAASPASAGLIDGLEGYWPFEDVAQPGKDESGNGRDGSLVGTVAREGGGGVVGAAMRFNNHVGDEVDATGHTMPATNAITLSAWVNHDQWDGATTERYVVMPSEVAVIRRQWDRSAHFFIKTDGTVRHLLGSKLFDNSWYHIVGTWDGTTQKLYVNGSSISATPPGTLDPINDGAAISWAGGEGMDGRLDEVAIWSRALEQAEIDVLWNSGAGTSLLPLINVVPEPAGLSLLGLALLAVRKRRS